MRLCGVNIPYEHLYAEKTAANRIHNTATTAKAEGLLKFDNLDIAGMIYSHAQDAAGILNAVKQRKFVDLQGSPISPDLVKEELDILSEDLAKVAALVKETLNSEAGKQRWAKLIPNVHGTPFSIPVGIEAMIAISKAFKELSTTIAV